MWLKGTTLLSIPHDRKEKVRGNKTKVRAGRGPGEGERGERRRSEGGFVGEGSPLPKADFAKKVATGGETPPLQEPSTFS